ncbi:MAG: carboxypeptidase-like regulatory domain-containing protein [Spirosomataceae bacterium]
MKNVYKLLFLAGMFVFSLEVTAQSKIRIYGTVSHNETKLPIQGVSVTVTQTGYGNTTDENGRFELFVPVGTYLIEITHASFFKKFLTIQAKEDAEFTVFLDEKVNELEEVRISASSSEQNVRRLGTGVTTINAKTLRKLPSLLGEVDIIKSLFTLPGVTSVGEGASGFNVRGGNIDQNLILLDDAPIFNSSHLMGFFSVFNPDTFRDFNFYRGGIPAQYGGRISSVLTVNLKDANADKLKVNGGVGTISSRLLLETPIIKDKLGFYIAGRVSYIVQLLQVVKVPRLTGSRAAFYDITSKLDFKPTTKDRISFSVFHGDDTFQLAKDTVAAIDENGDALYRWNTTNATAGWSHYFGPKLSLRTSGVWSQYNAKIQNDDSTTAYRLDYNIQYRSAKSVLLFNPSEKHEIELGLQWNDYQIQPGSLLPTLPTSNKNPLFLPKERGSELAAFLSEKCKINEKIELGAGLRAVQYRAIGASTVYQYESGQPRSELTRTDSLVFGEGQTVQSYGSVEPRFALNITLSPTASIKASVNRMAQFIQLLSGTTAALPTDRWKLSDAYIKPQIANQYAMGYFKNFTEKNIETSVEVFYKQLFNVVEYKDGEVLILNPFPETAILQGNGYAYGAEFYVKKSLGVLTGWLSYTYSQSRIQVKGETPEETINNGDFFAPIFNRPHSFNAIGSYQISKKVAFSSNVNFSSGRAITYPASKFYFAGASLPYYNSRNQGQIPNYVRLDLSMNIDTHPYKTSGYKGSWNISLYNVLARRNAYSVFFRAKNPFNQFYSRVDIYKLSVIGTIIPSVTYNFSF